MKCPIVLLFLFVFLQSIFAQQPVNDIVERRIFQEKSVLAYQPLREADLFWEKRVWQLIDTREKMNLVFRNPKAPFFQLLLDAHQNGQLTLYSTEDDQFTTPLTDLEGILFERDTVAVVDLETEAITYQEITNQIYYEDIKRFRIQEIWYFDENTSTLKVRILGIAPLIEEYDSHGNFRYEKPLFWVHYPDLRQELARTKVFNPNNDNGAMSWEDLFEMRLFSSTIYKTSNVLDNRLEDMYSGIDWLLEADKIKQEIFNFEHDLWSY